MASFQYCGTDSGRSRFRDRKPLVSTGARAASASTPTSTGGHHEPKRGISALTPAATRPARPSTRRGTARRVAQRQAGRGVAGERLEQRAVGARVVVGPGADGDDRADDHEEHEVGTVAPPRDRRRRQRDAPGWRRSRPAARRCWRTPRPGRSSSRVGPCRRRTSCRCRGGCRSGWSRRRPSAPSR